MSRNSLTQGSSLILKPTTAPLNPRNGQMYFDETEQVLKKYEGGAWKKLNESDRIDSENQTLSGANAYLTLPTKDLVEVLAPAPAPFQQYAVNPVGSIRIINGSNVRGFANTVAITGTRTVTAASFHLVRLGSPGGTVTAKLYNVSGGLPTTEIAASTPINIADITVGGVEVTFNFPTAAVLSAGTYAVSVEVANGYTFIGGTQYVGCKDATGSPIAGVTTSTWNGSVWTSFPQTMASALFESGSGGSLRGINVATATKSVIIKNNTNGPLVFKAFNTDAGDFRLGQDFTLQQGQFVQAIYSTSASRWDLPGIAGSSGGGDVTIQLPETLLNQTFEDAVLGDFTQTGLILETSSPLNGAVSAKLTHQASVNQNFKQVFDVPEIFRNKNLTAKITVKSAATAGDVQITIKDETNNSVLINAQALDITNESGGAPSFISFDVPATCASMSYEIIALPEAGTPSTIIDDITFTMTNLSSVQNVLVQEEDSYLHASGGTIPGNGVGTFPTIVTQRGDAFAFTNGNTRVVALKDGIFDISSSFLQSAAGLTTINIRKNGSTTLIFGNTQNINGGGTTVSAEIYLLKDEYIEIVNGSANAGNTGLLHVSYQGSLKQVTTNPNQKIKIPTSELRMEGASTRGSTDTAIVRFDTVAKLSGDAFAVESDAAFGTRVTMKKAGKLSVATSLLAGANITVTISKNQVSRNGNPTLAAERLSSATVGSGNVVNVKWEGDLVLGDVIRICSDGALTANISNSLNLSFQEQEIQVSVSNTLPQFSESDLVVRGAGNAGQVITEEVTNIPFTIVQDTTGGSFNGTQLIITDSGLHSFNGSVRFTTVQQRGVSLYVNGVIARRIGDLTSNVVHVFGGQEYFNKGDVISFRASNLGGTLSNDPVLHFLTITKVGKPNVTGVDVTPFIEIPQPTDQALEAFTSTTTFGSTNTGTPVLNITRQTGGGIFSVSTTSTLGTVITVTKRAKMNIQAYFRSNAANVGAFAITRNSTIFAINNPDGIVSSMSAQAANVPLPIGATLDVLPGDVLRFHRNNAAINQVDFVSITAEALSDQILTEPETFSTDTAALTYAPSSVYNINTLANAPVGTYITFTYAANTNTRVPSTVRPTQTDADMNTNGIQIFARAYNASSTAQQPAAFAIQIGKGLKGRTIDLYKSAGKITSGSLDNYLIGVTSNGIAFKEYNELTGILYVDAGFVPNASITVAAFNFSDITSQSSGYFVINASKNPALTGLQKSKGLAIGASTISGRTLPTSPAVIVYETEEFDTTGAYNPATGETIIDEDGLFEVGGMFRTTPHSGTVGHVAAILAAVDGTVVKNIATARRQIAGTLQLEGQGSCLLRLKKGQVLTIRGVSETATTLIANDSIGNYIYIKKVGDL